MSSFTILHEVRLKYGILSYKTHKEANNLCSIIITWVKYTYKLVPIAVSNSPGIFKRKEKKCFTVLKLYMHV